jgi:hypothetical protein
LIAGKGLSAEVVSARVDCYRSYLGDSALVQASRNACPFSLDPLEVTVADSEGTVVAVVKSADPAVMSEFAKRVKAFPGAWEI